MTTELEQLREQLARAEAERDAALKQSARWEIQAQDMRDRLIKAEAGREADGMSSRVRDLVSIVENYDPDDEDPDRDDRCAECGVTMGAPDEPGMEPTPFCNACAHAVVEELAGAVQDLCRTVRRTQAERDAQHDLVLRLTAERDAVSVVHACPPKGSGVMPCCGATPFEKQGERLTTNPALVTCDRQRLAADLDEARAQLATLRFLYNGGH